MTPIDPKGISTLTPRPSFLPPVALALLLLMCAEPVAENQPPEPPVVDSYPDLLSTGVKHELRFRATDPEGDSVAIKVNWGDGDTSDWTGFAPSGTWQTLSHCWADVGTCDLRAMAMDIHDSLSDWMQPHRVTLAEAGSLLWSFPVVRTNYQNRTSAAVGNDGTVYAGGDSLFAIAPDGHRLWGFPGPVTSTPAVGSDGSIYFASRSERGDNFVVAVDAHGEERWRFLVSDYVCSSPAVNSNGRVYFGSEDTRVYALTRTGNLAWSFGTGGLVQTSPSVAADGTVYIGSESGKLYALHSDGSLKWSYQTGDWIGSSAAIDDNGNIYFGSDDGNVYALDPDGKLLWSYATGCMIASSPAVGPSGSILVGSNNGYLYALDKFGSLKWRCPLGNYIWSAPAIGADGTVYVGSFDFNLYAVDSSGTVAWTFATGHLVFSSPVLTEDGRLLFIGEDGFLYCLLASGPPPAQSPWPMFKRGIGLTVRTGQS